MDNDARDLIDAGREPLLGGDVEAMSTSRLRLESTDDGSSRFTLARPRSRSVPGIETGRVTAPNVGISPMIALGDTGTIASELGPMPPLDPAPGVEDLARPADADTMEGRREDDGDTERVRVHVRTD